MTNCRSIWYTSPSIKFKANHIHLLMKEEKKKLKKDSPLLGFLPFSSFDAKKLLREKDWTFCANMELRGSKWPKFLSCNTWEWVSKEDTWQKSLIKRNVFGRWSQFPHPLNFHFSYANQQISPTIHNFPHLINEVQPKRRHTERI